MSCRRSIAVAVLGLAVCAALPATGAERLTSRQTARIDSATVAWIEKMHIPGLTIAVVADGALRWQKAYGLADVENAVPAKTTTVFRIASTSKPLTAVGALRLAEAGKLDLDAPIQRYAPTFPPKPHPITMRQLLAHLAGIRHYRRGEPERTDHFDDLTAALSVFANDSLEQEPGTRYTYSTFGYTLVGVAMEGASGMPFTRYMSENVFGPSGMARTRADDLSAIVTDRARGYSPLVYGRFDGQWKNAALMDGSYKLPGGGFLSTAEDLAKFAIALERGVLLSPASQRLIAVSAKTRDGKETGYSYGWYVEPLDTTSRVTVVHHGGVQPGFTSELWMLPDRHFAVAILTNLEGGGRLGLATLAKQISEIVLD